MYESLFRTLGEADKPQTLCLMQWVFFALRPLSVVELRDAMVSAPDSPYTSLAQYRDAQGYGETDEIMEKRICDLSRGLVEVKLNRYRQVVQFIHQSVGDYMLEKGFHLLEKRFTTANSASRGHFWLSRSCLRYLTMDELRAMDIRPKASGIVWRPSNSCEKDHSSIQTFPFAKYAIIYWIRHAVQVEKEQKEHFP